MGLTPFVPTESETMWQRMARVLKPLLLIFLITMAISYYYDVYQVSAPQDSQQSSNQSPSLSK